MFNQPPALRRTNPSPSERNIKMKHPITKQTVRVALWDALTIVLCILAALLWIGGWAFKNWPVL